MIKKAFEKDKFEIEDKEYFLEWGSNPQIQNLF